MNSPVGVCYLQVKVVQVPQQSEVLSTYLTNHVVLKEDSLNEEKTKRDKGRVFVQYCV